MKSVTKLICRDLRRAFGLRTLGIWVVMALFTIYFFFFSNGRRELVENNRLEYMSLFLPLIIFLKNEISCSIKIHLNCKNV